MIHRIIVTSVILLLATSLAAFGQADPQRTESRMSAAIQTEAQAQEKAEDWAVGKQDLVDEIRDVQTTITWYEYQIKKYEIYIGRLNRNIDVLREKKLQARKVREGLEPYLEDVAVDGLETFIESDLPFFTEEREMRIEQLRSVMNDPHNTPAEKLRKVVEALEIEARYGQEVSATDETLVLNGVETDVTILRLGRLAMFYQSLDRKSVGWWNIQEKRWEPLSDDFARDIRRGLSMARGERQMELIQLPVGAIRQ
jgi:septal ring factor EnvC (AmiA/AmiB activator)